MKTISVLALGLALTAVLCCDQPAAAQNFRENSDLWKTEIIRAKNIDTVRFEKHSFFSLQAVPDTTPLVYHEPLPDSVMPKSAIEVGEITIQAGTAEEVLALLEKQTRKEGADWIVGFNEPRMKLNSRGEVFYRSHAMLYKVINPEFVPESQIVDIDCAESHLQDCASVEAFVKHVVAKSGE